MHRQIDNVLWNMSDVTNKRNNGGNLIKVSVPLKVYLLSDNSEVFITGRCYSGNGCWSVSESICWSLLWVESSGLCVCSVL